METQLAALRHELEDVHTYEFVEATIQAPLAPGKKTIDRRRRCNNG